MGKRTRRLGSRRSAEGDRLLPVGKGDFTGAQVAKSAGHSLSTCCCIDSCPIFPFSGEIQWQFFWFVLFFSICNECLFLRISKGNYIILIIIHAYIFIYFLFFLIFIQLQLSAFSPHPSTPPQPIPPPSPTSTLPLDFALVSFIAAPVDPSSF